MTWNVFIKTVVVAYRTLSPVPPSTRCLKKHARVSSSVTTLRSRMALIIPFLRLYLGWLLLLHFVVNLVALGHHFLVGLLFDGVFEVLSLLFFLALMPSGVDGLDKRSVVDDWGGPFSLSWKILCRRWFWSCNILTFSSNILKTHTS